MTVHFDQLTEPRRQLLLSVVRSALFVVTTHFQPGSFRPHSMRHLAIWKRLYKEFDDKSIEQLDAIEAEACLEALHIALYSLGPFELHTVTGKTLREYASAGLMLAHEVHGDVYLGTLWTEEDYQ
jgi:hypothetical protein